MSKLLIHKKMKRKQKYSDFMIALFMIYYGSSLSFFLIRRGAFIKFIRNMDYKPDITKPKYAIESILGAFVWCESPEGHKYWRKLNDEFGKLVAYRIERKRMKLMNRSAKIQLEIAKTIAKSRQGI